MDDGEDGKQDGMERAERHADAHWWQCMMESAKQVALAKPYLFTDDIVGLCATLHPNASTHEHKAIGPLMRAGCRLGFFEPTQDFVESSQRQNHRRPCRVWHSLIYTAPHRKYRRRLISDPRQYNLDLELRPHGQEHAAS